MAYQGKFNQNRSGQDAAPKKEYTSFADLDLGLDMDLSFLDEIELEQQPAPTRKSVAAQAPVKKPAVPAGEGAPVKKPAAKKPVAPAAEGAPVKKPVAKKPAVPTAEGVPTKKPAAKKPAAPAAEAPRASKAPAPQQSAPKKAAPAQTSKKKQKKGPRVGGVIFYTLYFMFILVFFIGTYIGLQWLNGWLADYEQSQPVYKAEAVFQQLFTDPNWGDLYEAAGAKDSLYEGKEEYVNYMEDKTSGKDLTYMQTSAGLAKDKKKFIVYLEEEKVATFTLVDKNQVGAVNLENLENITDIPDWQLDSVEVFFERIGTYRIEKVEGHTAYVNGVALDDSFTIQVATTLAMEEYVPEGTVGTSTCVQEVNGIMELPEVKILDKDGKEMTVTYDEASRTFTERTETNTMTEDQKTVALEAAKANCLWMIEELTDRGKIAKYFDNASKPYKDITKLGELWMQAHAGYTFANEEVTKFCSYGEDMFSVFVSLDLNVTRKDGSVREFGFDKTLFFKDFGGTWKVVDWTNEDVSQPIGKVRLTFMDGNQQLHSDLYQNDLPQQVLPIIPTPEGKVFTGWATLTEENDSAVYKLVFSPDETGRVAIPQGTVLEPMVLYAVFEDADAAAQEGA